MREGAFWRVPLALCRAGVGVVGRDSLVTGRSVPCGAFAGRGPAQGEGRAGWLGGQRAGQRGGGGQREGGRPHPHPSGPGGQGQDGDFPAPVCSSALPRSAHSPRPRTPQGKRTR